MKKFVIFILLFVLLFLGCFYPGIKLIVIYFKDADKKPLEIYNVESFTVYPTDVYIQSHKIQQTIPYKDIEKIEVFGNNEAEDE